MKYYIGIDLGTSAMKLLLVAENGQILRTVTKEYPLAFPQPGWSEQNPEDWKRALFCGIPELLYGYGKTDIAGIGCAGQMHGLVLLDRQDRVIRPAILWNDTRTARQTEQLNRHFGKERLAALTGNIAFAGFTAPKLLWLWENEPETLEKTAKIMLPKDYLHYLLTGAHVCDYSDASGTLLLDVQHKCWSKEMLSYCRVRREWLPALQESSACIGTVKPEAAAALSLPPGVRVAAGAGDNAAAAIGAGVLHGGSCSISLGTSGTIFFPTEAFRASASGGLHTFAHANGNWHLLSCILSAASCNKWFTESILHTTADAAEQAGIPDENLGRNRVFFLPYLMGERSPINDTDARGAFLGLSLQTTRADLLQAVLEGVAFAFRDCLEAAAALGVSVSSARLCGGGAKSPLWCRILAAVLHLPLELSASEQGPGMGGAILAMVACGAYPDAETACRRIVTMKERVLPDEVLAVRYEERYRQFRLLYPALKPVFPALNQP